MPTAPAPVCPPAYSLLLTSHNIGVGYKGKRNTSSMVDSSC